mgnify:CR=1 FL=1
MRDRETEKRPLEIGLRSFDPAMVSEILKGWDVSPMTYKVYGDSTGLPTREIPMGWEFKKGPWNFEVHIPNSDFPYGGA